MSKELITTWKNLYSVSEIQFDKLKSNHGIISSFNTNIDAVIKIDSKSFEQWVHKLDISKEFLHSNENKSIDTANEVFRGFFQSFKHGIAQEWLITNEETYHWISDNVGYDKLQMGGQAGIIANTVAICGIDPVFVHCSSLPKLQSDLFLDIDNLYSFDNNHNPKKASSMNREDDIPLIHWILEFTKGDTIELFGEKITCPKSNRFIATYDPLNFDLHIDDHFNKGILKSSHPIDFVILSGFQMLTKLLPNGDSGSSKIDNALNVLKSWKTKYPSACFHLELASTQDPYIRKYVIERLCTIADSLGCNEQELIDLLEIIGENELYQECKKQTNSVNLFKGLVKLFYKTECPRIQLHMFGLYITISRKNASISPSNNLKGMVMAASIAASKAAKGTIYDKENIKYAFNMEVSEIGINELSNLSNYITTNYGNHDLLTTGVFEWNEFDIVAIPTIIIENPVSLVGMGDTISSLSLIGSKP